MKISMNWLRSCVELDGISTTQIQETLTGLGLEVESVQTTARVQGDLLFGRILQAEAHPNADSLRVCQVDVGTGEHLQIVCGASNARADIYVCVATVGCVLPGDFKIKKAKIRGVESCGMLCAASEIGVSGDNGGIMEIEAKHSIGQDLKSYFALEDTCMEINVTPNRPDCLSHYGIARDLAAKFQVELKPWNHNLSKATVANTPAVCIKNDLCTRFVALRIDNIQAKASSPSWMQERLEACGIRPISLIVDCANYCMLHTGQPIHTYDADKIDGALECRLAHPQEKLITLDDKEWKLSAEDLVIADKSKAVGLAGVMGGANTAINDITRSLILEVACFDPSTVRKTAKRYAYHTDASHRFERGVDVSILRDVAMYFLNLLKQCHKELELNDLRFDGELSDVFPAVKDPVMIAVRLDTVRRVLSDAKIEMNEASELLKRLGIHPVDQTPDNARMLFQIPPHRLDLLSEIDLIEEIARLRGFENILECSLRPSTTMQAKDQCLLSLSQGLRQYLATNGLCETISFPFVSQADLKLFGFSDALALKNPIADHLSHMRPSALISLYNALKSNQDRFVNGVKLFELGRVYGPHVFADSQVVFHTRELRQKEINVLSFIADESKTQNHWISKTKCFDIMDYKGLMQSLMASLGITDLSFKAIRSEFGHLHPRESLEIWQKDLFLGYLGRIHPRIESGDVFAAEVCIDSLYLAHTNKTYSSSVDLYPAVDRDLSFVVNKTTAYSDVEKCLSGARFRFLKSYQVFDVFESERLGLDRKSLAMNFVFQSPKKTLSDQDIAFDLDLIRTRLSEDIKAEFR
jgi:phenylalanyl-tRNA synthetase beta chain